MREDVARWLVRRTYVSGSFDARSLLAARRTQGATISVVLPALDEERTVGTIVEAIRRDLVDRTPLVDEVVVIDSGSTDRTSPVARAAGARVVHVDEVLPGHGAVAGKGEALWKSLHATSGDLL